MAARYHCMQFQGKLMNQTLENGKKTSFKPIIGPFGRNLGSQNIWLHQSQGIMVSYHHVQDQKKTNDPILIKQSDKQTHRGQRDRQTSDFIGRCLTNFKHTIQISLKKNFLLD